MLRSVPEWTDRGVFAAALDAADRTAPAVDFRAEIFLAKPNTITPTAISSMAESLWVVTGGKIPRLGPISDKSR